MLNSIEISENHLITNYNYLCSLNKNISIAPVLKSNAYGHGIKLVSKIIDDLNPPFICVDSLYEAYQLMKISTKSKILVMGYVHPNSLDTKKLPLSFAVFNLETIIALQKFQPQANIHIFIDTGMHREGINLQDLPEFLTYIKTHTKLTIEGLMSHLAMSTKPDHPFTQRQVELFQKAQTIVYDSGITPRWIHIANSSGIINHSLFNNSALGPLGNVARTGRAFYGYDPHMANTNLLPALELKTFISQIKHVQSGDSVGYDFMFTASHNLKIALLPIGYNDGVDRRLSNRGFVVINNQECPIIGRISMNMTTIDISSIPYVQLGTPVTIFSSNPLHKNSIEKAAQLIDTIPHELLIHLNSNTKRIKI